uniref:Uncharacterized protein n=1 Tax=Avena sativa TaxID=4498 RepID=A0ACD5WGR3_AVESA
MKLEDGDSQYGRFVTPSGGVMKSFSEEAPLPSERKVKVHFHGYLSKVVDVLSSFDDQKTEILRSMKFQGLLNLAKFPKFDLYFCLWLMTKVDCSRCSIRMNERQEIPIRDIDVGHILELPWYGQEMFVQTESNSQTVSQVLQKLRQSDSKANLTVGYLEEILRKNYGGIMTKEQIDAFKIAFVVFSMSNVLCTGGNPKSIPLGLLQFLTVPDEIHMFNWCLLLRRYMVSWCHLVQQQVRMRSTSITIGGCFLLPMVTYLDNILLGSTTMLHYQFPRAAAYSLDNMKYMIEMDTVDPSLVENGRVFGKSQLKRERDACYGRMLVDTPVRTCIVAKLVLLARNKVIRTEIMKTAGVPKRPISQNTSEGNSVLTEPIIGIMDAFIEETRAADTTRSSKCSEFYKELQEEAPGFIT